MSPAIAKLAGLCDRAKAEAQALKQGPRRKQIVAMLSPEEELALAAVGGRCSREAAALMLEVRREGLPNGLYQ
jgi:hypothetical protein